MYNSHNHTEFYFFLSCLFGGYEGILSTAEYGVVLEASDFKVNYDYMDTNLLNWL